jgi:glycosyltransferase involved in cell wall biosynthesis
MRPLRVLSIAHPAVKRHIGRLRYHPFSRVSEMEIHLLVPAQWREYGRVMTADPADDPGVTLHIRPIWLPHLPMAKWYAHFYPGLKHLVSELNPDVIHLWEEPWSIVSMQAAYLKGDAALVLEVDQNLIRRLPLPFETVRHYVLGRTSLILSRSDEATAVVRAFGFAGPVRLIGYGVDQDIFRAGTRIPQEPGTLKVGYVGRIVEQKGLDDILMAVARARSSVTLDVMGEGPYRGRLQKRIGELGLRHKVNVYGWGGVRETAQFLRSLDVSVLLSRSSPVWREQFGRTIIESQSCGIPVIGAESGAIPEVIGNGGWTVPERDPTTLAELFDRLSEEPGEVIDRGRLGLANVASRFTYERTAQILADAWNHAASRKGASY